MGVHDGHRQRMRKRFLEYGIENFDDHNVLEMLLFYSNYRGDTNPIAHELIDHFGSFAAVFDAPIEELKTVKGVGENAALLIKLIPQVAKRYSISKDSYNNILSDSESAGKYLLPRFFAECEEVVYLVCLDAKCKVQKCQLLCRGGMDSANVDIRKIVEIALAYKSGRIIIAHNHPGGIALPSREDIETTRRLKNALKGVNIILADHIVVANDDFVSMADSGYLNS